MNLYQDAEQVLACHVMIVLCSTLGVAHPPIWAQPLGASSSCSQGAGSAAGSSGGAAAASILILCSSAPAVRGTFAGFSFGVGVVDLPLEAPVCAYFACRHNCARTCRCCWRWRERLVDLELGLSLRRTRCATLLGRLYHRFRRRRRPAVGPWRRRQARCVHDLWRVLLFSSFMFEDSKVCVLASSDGHLVCLIWRMSTQFHLLRGLRPHLCDPCRLRLAPWFSALYFL